MKIANGTTASDGDTELSGNKSRMAWGKGDTEELQRQRREEKPFIYCRLVANYPRTTFAITLSCHILMFVVAGILFATGYELFPTNFEVLPMELYNIPYRLRDYAWRDRDKYSNEFERTLTDSGFATFERGLYYSVGTVTLYYDAEGGNIFTPSNLRKIQEIENDLESSPGYTSTYCMTHNSSLVCKPFKSILRYFDGTYKHINSVFDDPNFNNIAAVLYEANTNNQTNVDFQFFLPNSYSITPTSAYGSITRSEMLFGCSLTGATKCNTDSVKDLTQEYLKSTLKEKLEGYLETSQFDFYYLSYNLWSSDVFTQAIKDMLCAVGSMKFIFIFMLIHTRSFFITGLGIMSIFACFIGTEILYVGVVGFKYFGFFHILSIFIILGIGADDIFVFYDSWRLTAFSTYPSLAHRLSDAYKKSVLSMFITSLTTCSAFLCSAISPLLATRSFGVFSAMLIIYNYLSVIIYFPTVVMMYHLKFEDWHWPCCRKCAQSSEIGDNNEKSSEEKEKPHVVDNMQGTDVYIISEKQEIISNTTGSSQEAVQNQNVKNELKMKEFMSERNAETYNVGDFKRENNDGITTKKSHPKRQKKLVIFFRDYYFKFVTHKIAKWIVLPIFAIFVIVFGYQASKLEPDNEQLKIFKDSHRYTKSRNAELYSFVQSTSSSLVTIYVAWGLGLKDRSECHFSSIDCRGTNVYDSSFDPNPVANQQALKSFCDDLYGMTTSELNDFRIKIDSNGDPEIGCFTRNLETYLTSLPHHTTQGGSLDLTLPWSYTKMINFMTAEPSHYNTTGMTNSYTDVLSIPMQYWMYKGYTDTYTEDYGMYNTLFGEQKTSYTQNLLSDASIKYGNKLMYIGIQINTTINMRTTGYSKGIPLIEKWETFINNKMSAMPSGVNSGYQLTRQSWHWIYVQKALADNAVLGIIIGVSIAFPILTLATMNIVIGFLATTSICCTTICVIGVIPSAGWKLGLLVSLNMCLVVGLAVDYVVHLAEGYHLSLHKDRLSRTRDMLEEMGMSVFSGACTTLGASLFMFLSQVQFFLQFGIFVFCTIGFSIFFSLGLFTILMGLIGPQNEIGDLRVIVRWCKRKFKRGKQIHHTQEAYENKT
ncbi:hypothetical protein FSP39_002236 [Pinctada imbricata]|uniref:SSD domain-containing protein n=1 Tax=Pinctada imbricata TaxID=66713 RepID=A0AA88Y1T4_PINIB|nr:hypothetical protein FSP39_002236 [Pinctada imbricata]